MSIIDVNWIQNVSIDLGEIPIGQTLLIVGVSTTAPASAEMAPLLFRNPRDVAAYYGHNTLSRTFYEAYRQGAPYITTMSMASSADLSEALSLLVDYDIDILCLPECRYDLDIADMLGPYVYERVRNAYPTVCVVPARGTYSQITGMDPGNIQRLVDGPNFDATPYIVTPAGTVRYNTNTVRQYETSLAGGVAGVIAATRPERSIVNIQLTGATIPDRYATNQIAGLFNGKYVFADKNPRYDAVLYGGRTISSGDFLDLVNARIAQTVCIKIKRDVDGYIGESPSVNRLRGVVNKSFDWLVENEYIKAFVFNLLYDGPSGQVQIDAEVVPYFAIRSIEVSARVDLKRIY